MKHPHTRFMSPLLIGAILSAGLSTASAQTYITEKKARPIVITPPAVKDGSNFSRAPYVAARQFDDAKAPDGDAIDRTSPPNTVATNIEPPLPSARVAILQPASTPTAVAAVSTEPVLTPTGRSPVLVSTTSAAAPADDKNTYVYQTKVYETNAIAPTAVAVVTTEPVLTPTGRSMVAISTSLDAATLAPSIRATPFGNHQIITDIESRVESSDRALAAFDSSIGEMSAEGRKAFNLAADAVKEKATALKKSIKNAHNAKDSDWENARTQLAADYEAYAAAVARVDAAAGIAPANR